VNAVLNHSSGHRRYECCVPVLMLYTAWSLRDVVAVSIGGVLQPLPRCAVVLICVCGSRKSNAAINAFQSFNYSLPMFANRVCSHRPCLILFEPFFFCRAECALSGVKRNN